VSENQIFNLVLDNKEAVASLNAKIEELREASNNVWESVNAHQEQQSSKIVTPEGDVLSPMTPETLTRIRDLAKKAGESARARGDLQQAEDFDELREAASGLLEHPDSPNRAAWISIVERMTTAPAHSERLDIVEVLDAILAFVSERVDAGAHTTSEWLIDQASTITDRLESGDYSLGLSTHTQVFACNTVLDIAGGEVDAVTSPDL